MNPQPVQPFLAAVIEDSERGSDHAAVERHAAIPHLENVDRVLEVIGQVVEQDVAEPAAEENSDRGIKAEVLGVAPGDRRPGLLDQPEQVPITNENSREVGKAVPFDFEEAEVECHRRQMKVGPGDCV